MRKLFTAIVVAALFSCLSLPVQAAAYRFTRVADSVRDDFNLGSFTCSSINNRSAVAFKASRTAADGFNFFDGVYRRDAGGRLVTIAEDPARTRFSFFGNNLSLNDMGEVAFGANLLPDFQNAIVRGDGGRVTTIARTGARFGSLGFDVSIDKEGEVAFVGQLGPGFAGPQGLFSGDGGQVSTHYRNDVDVQLDGHQARFFGSFDRPSIKKHGEIAFQEFLQPNFESGIFIGQDGKFRTIAIVAPFEGQFGEPSLNDLGTAAFQRSYFDGSGTFVTAISRGDGGRVRDVADTRGDFGFFGPRPPAINDRGDVAFLGIVTDFSRSGIFTGPRAGADKVIADGDALDGGTVASFGLQFCEEGLNNDGEVAFIALLNDAAAPFGVRSAVFRATPIHR